MKTDLIMVFNDSEKEFIRTILKYEEQAKSLADALNKSRFFERKGIGLVQLGGKNILFINKEIYDDYFQNNGLMYFEELLSLLDKLIERRYITIIHSCMNNTLVIGARSAEWYKLDYILANGNELICVAERQENWFDTSGQQKYWPYTYLENELSIGNKFNYAYTVSEELKDLAKHNFKSEEERRFIQQQRLTWISIGIATAIGILGILL